MTHAAASFAATGEDVAKGIIPPKYALCGITLLAFITACSPDPYCSDLLALSARDDARLLREVNEIRREIRRGPQVDREDG